MAEDGGNPEIEVELTGAEELECFRLRLGDSTFRMHARDLADLNRKAQLALLDWLAQQFALLIEYELTRRR